MRTSKPLAAFAAFVLLAALAIPAASQDNTKKLTGSYAIAGRDAVDPPPGQPKDTHLQLFLTGGAARDLYNALKVKAVADECLGDGARSKFQGAIACTMQAGGKQYECSLAIDLRQQKLESAYAC
jgi:hypothetical protein